MKRELPDGIEAKVSSLVYEAYDLRDRARRSMYGLQREFNAAFRDAFLRLRPWSRRRGTPPYSLCWVRIFAGKYRLDPRTLSAVHLRNPWPFRRLVIRSNRDLDTVIHRCQLDAHRALIFDFHRKAQGLNEAAHACNRALDIVRKLLSGRAADGTPYSGGEVFRNLVPQDMADMQDRLRQFAQSVSKEIATLERMAHDYHRAPWCATLDLVFIQDLGFPFGRLLWIERPSGIECARLGRRLRRRLALDAGHRALLTYVERSMARLARLLLRRHAAFQKMLRLLTAATATAQPILERIKPPRTMDEVMNDFRGGPRSLVQAPWELRSADSDEEDWA